MFECIVLGSSFKTYATYVNKTEFRLKLNLTEKRIDP